MKSLDEILFTKFSSVELKQIDEAKTQIEQAVREIIGPEPDATKYELAPWMKLCEKRRDQLKRLDNWIGKGE